MTLLEANPVGNLRVLEFGDMDGDGDIDLVAGGEAGVDDRIRINDGSGHIASVTIAFASESTHDLSLGDINGDGSLDIVIGKGSQAQSLINDGSGNMTQIGVVTKTDAMYSIALGDVDNDGDLDLAAVGTDKLVVYHNNGAGLFTDWEQTVITGAAYCNTIEFVDIDCDGDIDLACGRSGTGVNTGFRFCLNDGTGIFDSFSCGVVDKSVVVDLVLFDVDGDEDMDLAYASRNSIPSHIYFNDGSGQFSVDDCQAICPPSHISLDKFLTTGDLNGDEILDLVFVRCDCYTGDFWVPNAMQSVSSIEPAHNTIAAASTSIIAAAYIDCVTDIATDTFIVHAFQTGYCTGAIEGTGTCNVSFDASMTFKAGERIEVALASKVVNVSMGLPVQIPYVLDFWTEVNPESMGQYNDLVYTGQYAYDHAYRVETGDINNDGYLDFAVSHMNWYGISTYETDENHNITLVDTFDSGHADAAYAIGLKFADMDGDSDLDLVAGMSDNDMSVVYFNSGGRITSASTTFNDGGTAGIDVGDVDGDGDLDIVHAGGSRVEVYVNDGSANFTTHSRVSVASGASCIRLWDFDNDGDLDIAVGGGNPSHVYFNDGKGVFERGSSELAHPGSFSQLEVGDLNGDGYLDIVLGSITGVCRFLNDCDGNFPTAYGSIGSGRAEDIALLDADGDGDLDLAVGYYDAPSCVYPNNGLGVFYPTQKVNFIDTNCTRGIGVGDLNGDRAIDIIGVRHNIWNYSFLNMVPTPTPTPTSTHINSHADSHADSNSNSNPDSNSHSNIQLAACRSNNLAFHTVPCRNDI